MISSVPSAGIKHLTPGLWSRSRDGLKAYQRLVSVSSFYVSCPSLSDSLLNLTGLGLTKINLCKTTIRVNNIQKLLTIQYSELFLINNSYETLTNRHLCSSPSLDVQAAAWCSTGVHVVSSHHLPDCAAVRRATSVPLSWTPADWNHNT